MKSRVVLVAALLVSVCVFADPVSEARKLKDEAVALQKKNSNREPPPEEAAKVIFNLEKAMDLIEKAGDTSSDLAQEVSGSLFWARKFSNVKVMAELDKMKGGTGNPVATAPKPAPAPAKPAPPPPPANSDEPQPEAVPQNVVEARNAFDSAQKFAAKHSGDDYLIAVTWFKVASEHTGTDYALKALGLARDAQDRFAKKTAVKTEPLPDTPEMKPVIQGDGEIAVGRYDQAIELYQSSVKTKDNIVARRRLAKAYFDKAQRMKDDLMPKFEANDKEVLEAWRGATIEKRLLSGGVRKVVNQNDPKLVAARRKRQDLINEAYKSLAIYDNAKTEYNAVLKLAPGGKDLEAAGRIGLCYAARGDAMQRSQAKVHLTKFLAEYKPVNDIERALYEYCKSDLERIRK